MKLYLILFTVLCTGALIIGCQPQSGEHAAATEAPAMTHRDSVKRGEYLVMMNGCHDCHSPKVFTDKGEMMFDTTRLLSGHPASAPVPPIADKSITAPGGWILFGQDLTMAVGPWGTSYAANLTPDPSGTGEWTFDNFKKVLTEGKFKGLDNGRPIMPPMPWQNFAHMNNQDMHMIWTFLRSLKPINNVVPAYTPPGQ